MQPPERIVADRAQGDDLVARLQRERVVHLDGSDLRVERQIMRAPIVNLHQSARAFAFGPCHVTSFAKLDEIWLVRHRERDVTIAL
jgi:hypothetical protein